MAIQQTAGIAAAGYRLPAGARVGRVRLQVADLERSLAFYGAVLGFRITDRGADRASLSAGEGPPLVELVEVVGSRPAPRRGRLGLYHFAILLPDRSALGRFVSRTADARIPIGASDHLVSEALYLTDPDGLGIEVYADRPRATWRYQGAELAMATEPLDLGGLVAAGKGEPWVGMPEGTVIGHVHLHVGGIQEAEAFYHGHVGFDKVVWSYPGALFMSAGGYHHHLGTNVWAGPGAVTPPDDEARLLDWELLLPSAADADALATSLRAGGQLVEPDGDARVVADPWGTRLRFRSV